MVEGEQVEDMGFVAESGEEAAHTEETDTQDSEEQGADTGVTEEEGVEEETAAENEAATVASPGEAQTSSALESNEVAAIESSKEEKQ